MKFGGTSVADIDRIRNVARHVKREVDAGHEVAVVVSAMAGMTNQLVGLVHARPRLCMMRANTTRWSLPANRSPPACWPSRCRTWTSMRGHGRAGSFRS